MEHGRQHLPPIRTTTDHGSVTGLLGQAFPYLLFLSNAYISPNQGHKLKSRPVPGRQLMWVRKPGKDSCSEKPCLKFLSLIPYAQPPQSLGSCSEYKSRQSVLELAYSVSISFSQKPTQLTLFRSTQELAIGTYCLTSKPQKSVTLPAPTIRGTEV